MTSSVILNSPLFPWAIKIEGEEVIFKSCLASKSFKLSPRASVALENCRIKFHFEPKTGPEFPTLSSPNTATLNLFFCWEGFSYSQSNPSS